jgi:predicted alpha-1,2-mannosidase
MYYSEALRKVAFFILSGIAFASMAIVSGCQSGTNSEEEEDYVSYVDVKIGSGGHGHVFVGANVPFGMVQLGPTSIPQSWDWCSGYHASDSTVIGFSHTHLSGTGIGDLFDVTLMPVVGSVTYARGEEPADASAESIAAAQATGMWSYADRTKEVAEPGYYSVPLTRYDVTAEMTATCRVGLSRYTFPASDSSAVVLDLVNGGCWDKLYDAGIEVVNDSTLRGWRFSNGWAKDQKLYYFAKFSKPFDSVEFFGPDGSPLTESATEGRAFGRACYKTTDGEQIMVKVAISPVSMEKAEMNMSKELPGWDFDATRKAARTAWNAELGKIRVNTTNEDNRTILYTALYHSMIEPATFSDADADTTAYTVFSLWDTYRTEMPLMTLIHPEKENDMVKTMLGIYQRQGRLPVWHLWGNETDCMVGDPGSVAVADAIVKGFDGFDKNLAWEALKTTGMTTERGKDIRQKYGFIPSDLYNESIGNDMEYAISDGAVANAADYLGKTEDAKYFRERSHSYRHYMDKETLQARGRMSDGSWRTPFNPFLSDHRHQDYVEGTAWQYTWLAPQDFDGLVDFYGSKEKLVERLDTLFNADSRIEGENASADISGLIGQYVHGNEPSHHIIYFYTMAGAPGKAADYIRRVYREMYTTTPEGLAGNEDAGQMSAWYIMSSMGFYEVEPASTRFWFGAPNFEEMWVKVFGGTLHIKAEGLSDTNKYIQSVTFNGKTINKGYIEYTYLASGGDLVFTMGPEPKLWY